MQPEYHRQSCPQCGQYVDAKCLYLQLNYHARWDCPCCASKLCFDSRSRWWATLGYGLWYFFISVFVYRATGFWVSLVVACVGSLLVAGWFQRVKLVQPIGAASSAQCATLDLAVNRVDGGFEPPVV